MKRTAPSWQHDQVVDRLNARVRLAGFGALVVLLAGTLFGGTITTLIRPLTAAVEQLGAQPR